MWEVHCYNDAHSRVLTKRKGWLTVKQTKKEVAQVGTGTSLLDLTPSSLLDLTPSQ